MFKDIVAVYDLVKSHRDYLGEATVIRRLLESSFQPPTRLLEVACGTGKLLDLLAGHERTGIDSSAGMLLVAAARFGDTVMLREGRMEDFRLDATDYNVLLCLDGAIGYVGSDDLKPTLLNFAAHLTVDGLIIIEPWYSPADWLPGRVHVVHHQDEGTTVVRVGYGYPDGTIDFHTTVGTTNGVHAFDERYKFTLHTREDLELALAAAGFVSLSIKAAPPFKRGLIVARRK